MNSEDTKTAAAEPAAAEQPREHGGPNPLAVVIGVPILVAVMLSLFAWPSSQLEPRELPLGVAGPAPVAGMIEDGLAKQAGEDAFDVHTYADQAEARAAIEDREVYGAIVGSPTGITVLTASGASPMVAQLLQQASVEMAANAPAPPGQPAGQPADQPGGQPGGQPAGPPAAPKLVDVVPSDSDDPRGAVLGSSVLPLVLAGMATAMLLAFARKPGFGQALALITAAALSGLVVVGITQGWLSAFGGDWWVNGGVFALTILAIGAGVAGLGAVLGPAGLGLGAAVMMLVGNPFSGLSSAPELLPTWVGLTGQYLPPGAGGNLLRSTAYFDGAGAEQHLIVLASWAAAGLLLVVIGRWIRKEPIGR